VKAAAGRASVRVARGSEMGQGGARGSGGRRGCSEWVAVVACHNGGGGGRFGRGLAGVVVGSDEGGGCSGHYGSGKGAGRQCARTRGSGYSRRSREEDDWAGPVSQQEGAAG
jgi:hypothetical protein